MGISKKLWFMVNNRTWETLIFNSPEFLNWSRIELEEATSLWTSLYTLSNHFGNIFASFKSAFPKHCLHAYCKIATAMRHAEGFSMLCIMVIYLTPWLSPTRIFSRTQGLINKNNYSLWTIYFKPSAWRLNLTWAIPTWIHDSTGREFSSTGYPFALSLSLSTCILHYIYKYI